MSLILEALKKSEAERQRQTGPTLLEVRVAKPQRRYPLWAVGVGVLLAINMVLLLIFMLRPSESAHTASVAAAPGQPPVPAPIAAAIPALPANAIDTAASQPVAPQRSAATPAPAAQGGVADRSATQADGGAADASSNPADAEPAVMPGAANQRTQHDYSSLPSSTELSGTVPDLRLDLHVYAERARDRYALINMQTVHEGDMLTEGVRVLGITRDGVALEYRGEQFMLRPQ
jgi:general secretion pathway protein B